MRKLVNAMFMLMAGVAFAAPDLSVSQPVRASDGYGDVRQANWFGAVGKWDEGRAFIAKLRARSAEKRNIEERQSVDMAEFALLRYDLKANKDRCIACLKTVYDADCTSFWGWPAYGFLKDLGVDVPPPPKDPLRGLGAWGDGVVNLEPKRLEADAGRRASNVDWTKIIRQPKFDGPKLKPEDQKPGSPVRRAILRKRLVEICGEKKILEILAMKGGRRLISRLWDDDATLEDFLLSGPLFNAPLALETLMTLFLNDEKEGVVQDRNGPQGDGGRGDQRAEGRRHEGDRAPLGGVPQDRHGQEVAREGDGEGVPRPATAEEVHQRGDELQVGRA